MRFLIADSTVPVLQLRPLILAVLLVCANVAHADSAPFDLAGPSLEVKVTHGATTLPISEVPNLAAGDHLWIRADLPPTQSEHYLMVVAFLQGSTNPPPTSWFLRCDTWRTKCARDGMDVIVPQDAQQVLLFLAPQTAGDFKTLVEAVRGRPGVFVRSSQDLNQATLDRSRLESYLSAIRILNDANQAKLKEAAPLLARSLAIKVDPKCLDRIPELQAPCLMQGQDSLILDDGHSTSIVEALTAGPASDLAMEASYTPQLSYGYYSPYIASVMDIARIFDSFRTAQYQYIPALVGQRQNRITLTLNTPPSFHDPKSVLVAALPAVERPQVPPLHAVDPKDILCARRAPLVLPVEGAPLVFSTGYAHEVTLTLTGKSGKSIELAAKADAAQGGYVVDTSSLDKADLEDPIQGSLHGWWGFETYVGPTFQLVNTRAQNWALDSSDKGALLVGRDNVVHIHGGSVSCIDHIILKDPGGQALKAEWKKVKPDEAEVRLALQATAPGALTLLITQYGAGQPQPILVQAFSEAGRLDHFSVHAGDTQGVLKGSRLDKVASLLLKGIHFVPEKLTSSQGGDELSMVGQATNAATALKQGDTAEAKITLKDGREFELNTSVEAPRPSATMIGKSVQPSLSSSESNIQLADQDELPQDALLMFSVRAKAPRAFTHDESIEVATADGSFSTTLNLGNGGIRLENARVAVATLNPTKAFGPSAFGRLQYRVVADGVTGDWQTLATLVRLPVLKDLKCPATSDLACKLSGSDLFLVDSVSSSPQFSDAVQVPDGFPGYALPVPHPTDGQLYVKLRDDPSVINRATLPTLQLSPSPDEAARATARQAATSGESAPVLNSDGKPQLPPSAIANLPAQQAPPSPDTPTQAAPPQQLQLQQQSQQIIPAPNLPSGVGADESKQPLLPHSS